MSSVDGTRYVRRLAAALLAGSTLCACSAQDSAPASGPPAAAPSSSAPSSSDAPSPTGPAPSPQDARSPAPLTGLPVSQEVSRAPVVAVPVTTGAGRTAPTGLEEADLAYVAFPGPDRQRVVGLYHSRVPERVGPVAQTRPMDGKLVGVFDAVLQYGGGPASFVRQLDTAGVTEWSSLTQSAGFTRDAAGLLYAEPSEARAAAGASPATAGVLAFSRADAGAEGQEREMRVTVPGQPALTLRYDGDDRRWAGVMGGLVLEATNVVLQEVAYEQLVLPKTGGAVERDPVLVGTGGDMTALVGEVVVRGSWNRRGRATLTSYVGADAVPVRLAPGTTRVLLVPEGSTVDDLSG